MELYLLIILGITFSKLYRTTSFFSLINFLCLSSRLFKNYLISTIFIINNILLIYGFVFNKNENQINHFLLIIKPMIIKTVPIINFNLNSSPIKRLNPIVIGILENVIMLPLVDETNLKP